MMTRPAVSLQAPQTAATSAVTAAPSGQGSGPHRGMTMQIIRKINKLFKTRHKT
jgi:hypothetical protein